MPPLVVQITIMAISSRNVKIFTAIAAVIFIGLLAYSSMRQSVYRYQVCMDFHGRTHCAEASGPKASDAVRSAQEIDCQLIADSRDENMVCLAAQPSRIREVSAK